MAITDLLGATKAATTVGLWDCTHRRFEPVLADLLPHGRAWDREDPVLQELVASFATEFSRVDKRAAKLELEFDPATAFESLGDWETMLGLPDCEAPDTIEGRRKAVAAKLLAQTGHDQSLAYWVELLGVLGYVLHWVLVGEQAYACGDGCNELLTDDEWAFVWQLGVLAGDNDPLLECVVGHQAMLETLALVHYMWTPVEVLPATKSVRGIASNVKGYTIAVGTNSLSLWASPDNQTWSEVAIPAPKQEDYFCVCAVDDVFVAMGMPNYVLYSIDNGESWLIGDNPGGGEVYGVSRSHNADTVAVAVGEDGRIYRSADSGVNWVELVSPTSEWLQAVTRCKGAMVAVGGNGTVVRSTNTTDWSVVSSGVTDRLWGVAAWQDIVVAVGEGGRIIRSVSGGQSWETVESPTTNRLYAVTSSPSGHWTACGVGGVVLLSLDDGATWTLFEPTSNDLYAAGIDWPSGQAIVGGDSRTIILE